VVIVGHPEALALELLGACDIFHLVNAWFVDRGERPMYRSHLMSLDGGPLPLWGGMELSATEALAGYRGPIDTLVVVGGHHAPEVSEDPRLAHVVGRVARRARRVVSLCTGAFILAAAGLLENKRATTHWMFGDELAQRHPDVEVDTNPIFIRDGDTWTSAGVTAGFDLLLAVIEEDAGAEAARYVARGLVLFMRRTGNQAQFRVHLTTQPHANRPVAEIQQFIADHPAADLSVEALARRAVMSPRNFARVFRSETGIPPGRYVEQIRIETARRLLEEGDLSVEAVARAAGFGSHETLRRSFINTFGIPPGEYRRRFGVGDPPDLHLVG
jgi:transcriptional regulator GlxA family with amidase domain